MAKRIKVGLIGLGRAGWFMICNELDRHKGKYQIVAGCDVITERCDSMAERYGCRTYTRYRDLIKDSDVELVVVASRSIDHYKHTIAALKAGKHVFVEKPMCQSHAEAVKMKHSADKSKGSLYVRHNRRFDPGFMHIKEIIESGLLGEVFIVKIRRNSFARRDDWQTIKKFGGGQLLNWGPHVVDHSLRLLGAPVESMWSDLNRIAAVGDAEDHVKIVMRGKNNRVVDMEISGGAAISEPVYIVLGSKGALKSDDSTINLRYLDLRKGLPRRRAKSGTPDAAFGSSEKLRWIEKTLKVRPRGADSKKDIWGHLYSAIREKKRFPVRLSEAVEVMKIISEAKKDTRFN